MSPLITSFLPPPQLHPWLVLTYVIPFTKFIPLNPHPCGFELSSKSVPWLLSLEHASSSWNSVDLELHSISSALTSHHLTCSCVYHITNSNEFLKFFLFSSFPSIILAQLHFSCPNPSLMCCQMNLPCSYFSLRS